MKITELEQIIKDNFSKDDHIDISGMNFTGLTISIDGMKAKEINQNMHRAEEVYQMGNSPKELLERYRGYQRPQQ